MLVALLVCLIPTTIGALLSAIGIAGMDRMVRANVIATSGRAVEAAGDVDVLLLDKTGTITLGDRQATAFHPAPRRRRRSELADVAQLASLADETPEGRSIVVLAKQKFQLRGRDLAATAAHVPQVLGADAHERRRRRGPPAAQGCRGRDPASSSRSRAARGRRKSARPSTRSRARARRRSSSPRRQGARVLGVIELRDIVKGGIRERFAELRQMGIKTVMVTGDNRLTAAAIAAEAGVDDFLAEATPETKLELIRKHQAEGRLVAMCGDGTNDAPALAQADVAVAMNTGTQAAKEAGNMVDLDSQPDEAHRGRRRRQADARDARRADDVLDRQRRREVLRDHSGRVRGDLSGARCAQRHAASTSPESAILSAVIFNALIIVALVPLALRGVKTRAASAAHAAAAEPADLRARRHRRAVHRHQG